MEADRESIVRNDFKRAVRGYDPWEVESHLKDVATAIESLYDRMATGRDPQVPRRVRELVEAERARGAAHAAELEAKAKANIVEERAEIDRLVLDTLVRAEEQVDRIQSEAKREREEAERIAAEARELREDAARDRTEAEAMRADSMVERARLSGAEEKAAETERRAREEAEATLAQARQEAEATLTRAREEAEATLAQARDGAETTVARANERAGRAVSEAEQRAERIRRGSWSDEIADIFGPPTGRRDGS